MREQDLDEVNEIITDKNQILTALEEIANVGDRLLNVRIDFNTKVLTFSGNKTTTVYDDILPAAILCTIEEQLLQKVEALAERLRVLGVE